MTEPRLEAVLVGRDLAYAYPGRRVVQGFTAEFPGGVTWLKGANGSGKSTLLKLLAGVLEPESGTRVVAGIDASHQPLAYRRQVFWCGPDALPFDHLLPMEYLGFVAGLYPAFEPPAVAAHLEGLGLHPQLDVPIGRLSTGTRRKVWLLAALAAGTPAVLLDEPLNALDEGCAAHLRACLGDEARRRRRCWLVASHEMPLGDPACATVQIQSLPA